MAKAAGAATDVKSSPPSKAAKFGPVRFDHICIGVHTWDDLLPLVYNSLGGRDHLIGTAPAFEWIQWMFANRGILESIKPVGARDGFLYRFLDMKDRGGGRGGPGVHHITFKVKDLEAARDHVLSVGGYQIVGWDTTTDPGWKEFFLLPNQSLGIVVQFAQVVPEYAGFGPVVPFPPRPICSICKRYATTNINDSAAVTHHPFSGGELPAAALKASASNNTAAPAACHNVKASLHGLRMVCGDRARTIKQFQTLLCATRMESLPLRSDSKAGGAAVVETLRFWWSDSPMCITVDIVPGLHVKQYGPTAIEWRHTNNQRLTLPPASPDRPTKFGAVFTQVDNNATHSPLPLKSKL